MPQKVLLSYDLAIANRLAPCITSHIACFTDAVLEPPVLQPPVLGFRNLVYSISEGETLEVCVEIFSGGSNGPFSLQMVSVSGTADGKNSI